MIKQIEVEENKTTYMLGIKIFDRTKTYPGWYCTVCKKVFLLKEESELHKHNEQTESDK